MTTNKTDVLPVSGATLFYRVRGTGPLLLILAGGHADADGTDAMCDGLVGHYTVATFDRRGLSRSTADARDWSPTITTYSDDAHVLLDALASEPALVFGSSIGALIGLDLALRHPSQVRTLVAHEPPAWDLLPNNERERATQALADVETTFRRDGAEAAFQKFGALSAIDYTDREPDAPLPQPTPQSQANLNVLLANDTGAVNSYHLDVSALSASHAHIVAASGRSSRGSAPHRCAERLAETLGTEIREFPGGHTGWMMRPKAFATNLREVLEEK